jgi:uncharacterized membrane protein (UPF0127 family)
MHSNNGIVRPTGGLQAGSLNSILLVVLQHLSAILTVLSTILPCRRRQTLWQKAAMITQIAPAVMLAAVGCSNPTAAEPGKRNSLDTMQKATITINSQPFEVWLALDDEQRQLGLMQVPAEDLAPLPNPGSDNRAPTQRGMLFVFEREMPLSFWMANTITALDIAYIAPDGQIVKTYTMAPLETRIYPSIEPAQFALEVRAGLFAELGISAGMRVEIPESVLKGVR